MTVTVLDPKDIIKDPTIGPVFDLNDDDEGMAAQFTVELLKEYVNEHDKLPASEYLAVVEWGLRQPTMIGLMLAKTVVTKAFPMEDVAKEMADTPVFKEMYTRYGVILDTAGNNTLGQYCRLRNNPKTVWPPGYAQ